MSDQIRLKLIQQNKSDLIIKGVKMKTFLFLVLLTPTIAFGNLVCPLIDGCPIKKGECLGCIIKTNHQH